MTASNRDEKLMQIQDEFGNEGYGLYWIILERIAEKLDVKNCPSVTLSLRSWARFCGTSTKKLQNFLTFAKNIGLFTINNSGSMVSITCDNLMKYRDEYTIKRARKSGQ